MSDKQTTIKRSVSDRETVNQATSHRVDSRLWLGGIYRLLLILSIIIGNASLITFANSTITPDNSLCDDDNESRRLGILYVFLNISNKTKPNIYAIFINNISKDFTVIISSEIIIIRDLYSITK